LTEPFGHQIVMHNHEGKSDPSFSTWLLMGDFKAIPFELEQCARRGEPLAESSPGSSCRSQVPGLISAFIFCFTLCWNEFIYALTFISSIQNKTVPVAIVNEFVDGDIYRARRCHAHRHRGGGYAMQPGRYTPRRHDRWTPSCKLVGAGRRAGPT
jgi:hypothetical protein